MVKQLEKKRRDYSCTSGFTPSVYTHTHTHTHTVTQAEPSLRSSEGPEHPQASVAEGT